MVVIPIKVVVSRVDEGARPPWDGNISFSKLYSGSNSALLLLWAKYPKSVFRTFVYKPSTDVIAPL